MYKEKLNILLAEDDLNLGMLLVDYLETEGFNVKLCKDGELALKAFQNNTFDLFNHNGKYFRYVYGLLSSTSKKGKKFENNAFKVFREVAAKKGIDVIIEDPSLKEDIYGGIDGTFMHRGKRFTIQVKPLFKMETYQKDPTSYIIFCDGVLKELKTDYLIVTNEKETKVFRSKGITVFPSYFIAPKSNII